MRNLRTLYATKELGFKTGYLLKGRRQQKAVGMDCMVPNKHPQQDPEYEQKMKSQSSYHSLSVRFKTDVAWYQRDETILAFTATMTEAPRPK